MDPSTTLTYFLLLLLLLLTSGLAALTIEALGLGNPICCAMGEGAGPPKMPKGAQICDNNVINCCCYD